MKNTSIKTGIVIYQAKSGAIELRGDYHQETVWATQAQIARAFDVDTRTINEHIINVYNTNELQEKSTIRNFRIVQKEGNRTVERNINHYNLDLILSVGYRVNSRKATLFRQWATKTLRAHIVNGYTFNRSRIAKNYEAFLKAVTEVKSLLPIGNAVDTRSLLELITLFAETWVSLKAYDEESLTSKGTTKKKVLLTAKTLSETLLVFKKELISKGEATDLFAKSRSLDAIESIVGNVMQSFGGQDVYESIEEKASHLLYFMVKNHPFVDGNKRSAALAFIWFLQKAGALDTGRLTPGALTALTLLIAESSPKDKQRLVGLILMLLK